jgi:hypothetical protein
VNAADEKLMRERFDVLSGPDDGNWDEVRGKARRRSRRTAALVAAVAVALVVTGLGFGGDVAGLFEHGKPVPLSSLSESDRQIAVFSLCRRIELVSRPGQPPREQCGDGVPEVREIANDGTRFYWKLSYPTGFTCLASGPVHGHPDADGGYSKIAMLGCNVGAPSYSVVPTLKRPITVDIALAMKAHESLARVTRASGLAGRGITSVGLVAKGGLVLKTDVKGHTYDFGHAVPPRDWIAIAAYDGSGKQVYREPVFIHPSVGRRPINPHYRPPPLPPLPSGPPLQHGETVGATIDVYASKLVAAHFDSVNSEVYRRLEKGAGPGLYCGDVAFGAGRWLVVAGGSTTAPLRQDLRTRLGGQGFPSPPYDYCEITGTYGRYWNDEEGTHELVEVPFTAVGRRFLDERATARDLAYLTRTRKMWPIRKAINRGETGPTSVELARLFGERVVPLGSRTASPPLGKVGIWSDGKLIVASELTPGGRRLFVTVRGMRIGANNIRHLSFVY